MTEVVVLPWFRLWTEFATDPEIQSLAFEDQRHYVMVLCLKRMGVLDKPYRNQVIRNRVIARSLGLAPREAAEAHHRLSETGLVDQDWQPRNWEKRQPAGDATAAGRMRRYRERQRGGVTSPLRNGDGKRVESTDLRSEEREDSLSEFRIPECPKDLDVDLEVEAASRYYQDKGQELTPARWRSWVLRAGRSGLYAKAKPRPPTEAEIRATRLEIVRRQEAEEQADRQRGGGR